MSDNKHPRRGGKGYYIALILCAAAIGITGYVYYRNANLAQEVSLQETAREIPALIPEVEDVPVIATQPPAQTTAPAATETTPAPTEKKVLKTILVPAGFLLIGL